MKIFQNVSSPRVRWGVLILLSQLLFGCTPFAVGSALGGAMGGCLASDRRSMQTIADDRMIHYQSDLKIQSEPALENTRIVLAVYNHLVLMVGQVQTESQRSLAQALILKVPEVKHVFNKLTIGPVISKAQQSKDAWITTKVIAKMLACTDLNTTQIKVVTENGTVYLLGIVTEHQAYAASEIARKVDGVKVVVKMFEYARVPNA